MFKSKINTLWGIVLAGLAVRLILMPFLMHPDINWVNFFPHLISYKGIWDPYHYFSTQILPYLSSDRFFIYGPLNQLTIAFFQFALKSFMPSFGIWMDTVGKMLIHGLDDPTLRYTLIPQTHLFINLFFMKLPYLIFDLTGIVFLWKCFEKSSWDHKKTLISVWSLSPIIIYSSYAFSHFDIMPTTLTLISVWCVYRGKSAGAIFFLALSILMKKYGVILILPYVIVLGKNSRERFRLTVILVVTLLTGILPFLFHSPAILHAVMQKKVVEGWAGFSGGQIEQVFKTFLFGAGYLWVLCKEWKSKEDIFYKFVRANTAILLLFYSLITLHIHYFVWITPYIIFLIVGNVTIRRLYYLQILLVFIYKLKRNILTFGLLAPLNPQKYLAWPGPRDYLNQYLPWGAVVQMSKIFFVILAVLIILQAYQLHFKKIREPHSS